MIKLVLILFINLNVFSQSVDFNQKLFCVQLSCENNNCDLVYPGESVDVMTWMPQQDGMIEIGLYTGVQGQEMEYFQEMTSIINKNQLASKFKMSLLKPYLPYFKISSERVLHSRTYIPENVLEVGAVDMWPFNEQSCSEMDKVEAYFFRDNSQMDLLIRKWTGNSYEEKITKFFCYKFE